MIRAKFVSTTHSGKSSSLDRWECPKCRENNSPECRFNLDRKKRGKIWKCRFCKIDLLLEVSNENC